MSTNRHVQRGLDPRATLRWALTTEGEYATWATAVTQAVVRIVGARSADLSIEQQGDDLAGVSSSPAAAVLVRRFPLTVHGQTLGMLTIHWDGDALPPGVTSDLLDAVVADIALAASVRTAMQAQQRRAAALARVRTARRIHDTVVQRLCGVSMVVGALGASDSDLEACGDDLAMALDELRDMLRSECDDAGTAPPGVALAEVLEAFARQIPVRRSGEPALAALPREAADMFVAGVREGLQNVVRHARPTVTSVRFAETLEEVGVVIRNDGVSDSAMPPGVGLQLLTFSVLESGGTLRSARCGAGEWRFELWLPRG